MYTILCSIIFLSILTLKTEEIPLNKNTSIPIKDQVSWQEPEGLEDEYEEYEEEEKVIKNIFITGNSIIPEETIRSKLPYKVGDVFNKKLSGLALSHIYSLGFFTAPIELYEEYESPGYINLHLKVTEKTKLSQVKYTGNKNLTAAEIEKKLLFSNISSIEKQELEKYAHAIKKLYREKNLHATTIDPSIEIGEDKTATVTFDIKEGKKSLIKRVFFKGNSSISSRILRSIIFTREDWILGMLDKAGTYHPDAIESDKYTIENYYQSNGFLTARVKDVLVVKNPKSNSFAVTFDIEEGCLYTLKSITAQGNEFVSEEQLLARIPLKVGALYSRDAIRQSLDALKLIWGEFGFIYADIEPEIRPDHENKTVEINFNSELGAKVSLNRIIIRGNNKTRDYVIRRKLHFDEGDILTTKTMEDSRLSVGALGYFDQRDGVNWKITRLKEDLADLELVVQEIKTGKLYAQASYGGVDKSNPVQLSSFKFGVGFSDRNFLGTGIMYDLQGSYSQQERTLGAVISNPWMFDRPLLGAVSGSYKQAIYEDVKNVKSPPIETIGSGALTTGFRIQKMRDLAFNYDLGVQRGTYKELPVAYFGPDSSVSEETKTTAQFFLDRQFQPGELLSVSQNISQDTRNNPGFPTRGHFWSWLSKVGFGGHNCNFGFFRTDFDIVWYTPLIGEFDLIFAFHSHAGVIAPFKDKTVPYRELFHIGGPTTVRGYVPGNLGPSIAGDSIGATRSFYLNAELVFPITKDLGTKARMFYDGGSGWGFVGENSIHSKLVKNSMFNYRHAIGFGFQMISPQPIRIDIGFKLDRNQRREEAPYEISFSMAQDFW